jgi:hypothetical protein
MQDSRSLGKEYPAIHFSKNNAHINTGEPPTKLIVGKKRSCQTRV